MKQFVKENIYSVLFFILMGLVLILWGRLVMAEFSHHAFEKHLDSKAARVMCLEHFGWQVDETSETEETVYIPQEFDNVWNRYNEIQKMCGFNLMPYRGMAVVRYTYRALNFPGAEGAEVFVNLLVADGTAIGGDCMTVALDGFMLPLDIRTVPYR